MTEGNIAATPISRAELRRIAAWMRNIMGLDDEIYMPVKDILERLPLWFESYGLSVEIVEYCELEPDEHGYFDPSLMKIVIREDIYNGACEGNGRDRMTVIHELCHFILIRIYGLKLTRRFGEVKTFEDPEWQAKALAGEFMMPADKIADMDFEQIAEECGVSYDAAMFQFNVLRKTKVG